MNWLTFFFLICIFIKSGDYSREVTPVPIPNTMVKHLSADDTWLETTRESKWLPDYMKILVRLEAITSAWRSYLPILLSQASLLDCLIIA